MLKNVLFLLKNCKNRPHWELRPQTLLAGWELCPQPPVTGGFAPRSPMASGCRGICP